jgi:hypothetical protein
MDALLLAVIKKLGSTYSLAVFHIRKWQESLRRVVGVQLNLVDGRGGLEARVGEELLKVLDGEVRDTDVLDAARLRELLKLSPGVEEVPVR